MEPILLLGIILFMLAAFAFEWMPIDVVALVTLAQLLLFDLVTPTEAVAGFSNPAVITVMMMFMLSESLVQSGLVTLVGHRIASASKKSARRASIILLALAGGLSAFINNVATVSILLPISIQLSRTFRFSPSRILLPLSYAAIFGGAVTLIGTSTNLLVAALAEESGLAPFGVFEFASVGIVLFTIGMLYTVVFMTHRLPERTPPRSLTSKYRLSAFLTELRVPDGSPLVGHTVVTEQISDRFGVNVIEILRGRRHIAVDLRYTEIEPDDVLLVRGAMDDIVGLRTQYRLLLLTDLKLDDESLADAGSILAEVQLSPTSHHVDRNIRDIDFRRRYGCFVLALNRTGEPIRSKITSEPLRSWDILLVYGPRTRVEALYDRDDFVAIGEVPLRLHLHSRWWIGAAIVPVVVLLAALGIMPILKASILGVAAVILTRSLTIQQAYQAVNWTVIFLVAGLIPLGTALEKTGLAATLGHGLGSVGETLGPVGVLALVYLVTSVLTETISNNSTAILMVPVAMTAARSIGVDPKPLVMAVAFAASASFLTPIGYKTNAIVYGPGGYHYLDYIKAGWPLKIVFWGVSTVLLPLVWPF